MKIIHEILNKEKKNNYLVTFRGKHVKLSLCDDGYTDSSAFYSLKTRQNKNDYSNDPNYSVHACSIHNDEQKHEINQNGYNYNHNHKAKSKPRSKSNSYNHNNYPDSNLQFSRSMPENNKVKPISNGQSSNDTKEDKKNDSMQLLVMRLKSLIENTIETQKSLQSKLKVLSMIDNGLTKTDNNEPSTTDEDEKNQIQMTMWILILHLAMNHILSML